MEIIYNGVHLSMLSLQEYSETVVYDPTQTDYLFTRHRIVGQAVANGQVEVREVAGPPVSYLRTKNKVSATAMERDTAPPGVNATGPGPTSLNLNTFGGVFHDPLGGGVFAGLPPQGIYARTRGDLGYFELKPVATPVPLTVQAIRHRLSVPRAQLFVFAGTGTDTEMILRSPTTTRDHCDAYNGPKPIATDLIYTKGEAGTHLFQFGIETFINESRANVSTDLTGTRPESPLLSNRFSMRHVVNEDQVTVIEVEGEAYFRTDGIYGGDFGSAVSPDDLRQRLFLPCPFGFVREGIVVEGMAAANGVRYSFRDRQMPVHFPGGAIWGGMRVSAVHTQAIVTDGDLITGTAAAFNAMTGQILNAKWMKESAKADAPDSKTNKSSSTPKAPGLGRRSPNPVPTRTRPAPPSPPRTTK